MCVFGVVWGLVVYTYLPMSVCICVCMYIYKAWMLDQLARLDAQLVTLDVEQERVLNHELKRLSREVGR